MNPLMSMLGGMGGSPMGGSPMGGGNIMMQAMGAMMRGESPQAFMQNLAKTNPQLKGIDMTNLQGTAQNLCNKNGVDVNSALSQVQSQISKMK